MVEHELSGLALVGVGARYPLPDIFCIKPVENHLSPQSQSFHTRFILEFDVIMLNSLRLLESHKIKRARDCLLYTSDAADE